MDHPTVELSIGPVAMSSARAWIEQAASAIEFVRRRDRPQATNDVVDDFAALLSQWREGLDAVDDYRWSGVVDGPRLRRMAVYWTATARAVRTPTTGLRAPGDDTRAFYDALVSAIEQAMRQIDRDGVADTLASVMPRFDDRIEAADPGPARQRRVLLVDDTEDIRLLVRIGLRADGRVLVCGEAVDGVDALEQAAALAPDVILLDLAMPRMGGLEALPQLKALQPTPRVVVFSADQRSRDAALAAGADAFLDKGTDPRTIADVLAQD